MMVDAESEHGLKSPKWEEEKKGKLELTIAETLLLKLTRGYSNIQ